MNYALEINSLSKKYKGFKLDDVSFKIPSGYIAGMIGPNGAGKTSIIKLVMNLIRRDSGSIKVFGLDNLMSEVEIKSRIGFVYDTPYFYDDVSLKDLKSTIAPFYKNWDETKFQHYAEKFELPLNKWFKKLSHGLKMKFSLALALSHDADLLLLDEPTSGLDPVFRRELLYNLSGVIQNENKSVLFSTHITSDLERIADYIISVKDGRVVFSDQKDNIQEKWGIVKGGNELLKEENKTMFKGFRKSQFGIEALTSDTDLAKEKFNSTTVIEKASLEDIMFFMTKGGENVSAN